MAKVSTIRHLPAAILVEVGNALGCCIHTYCRNPTLPAMFALQGFAKLILRPARTVGKYSTDQTVDAVRQRLALLQKGDLESLWTMLKDDRSDGVGTRVAKRRRTTVVDELPQGFVRRLENLVAEGAPKKALTILSSAGAHDPNDPEVWAKLRELHPGPGADDLSGFPQTVDPGISNDEEGGGWISAVRQAIIHFPKGCAPGPTGLRPSHLQDMLKRKGGGGLLLASLATLARMWCKGELPEEHGKIWNAANLTPLRKPDGGVRPVAVGDTLRRLVGKVLLSTSAARSQVEALTPTQVGVGVRSATESVAMGFTNLVNTLGIHGQWTALQVDLSNAFLQCEQSGDPGEC